MMPLLETHFLAASPPLGDLVEIIIIIVVVIIAPLAQALIKFFSPKKPEGLGREMERGEPGNNPPPRARPAPQHRPLAQALPPERMPIPPRPPIRPTVRPLPTPSGPALEPVRPITPGRESVPQSHEKARMDDEDHSRIPEILLEMLGVPAEQVRRQIAEQRHTKTERRQKREEVVREAKTSKARPKLSAPPPVRKAAAHIREPEAHISIHDELPSERTPRARAPHSLAAENAGTSPLPPHGLTGLIRFDKRDLRRAILLKEILGAPVSLRREHGFPD